METTEKRIYKVIVRNSSNKIEAMHNFDSVEKATECFIEFILVKYSHYHKITFEAIQQ